MNPGGLKWVLDAIRYPLFGVECYPTLADKASLLAWIIIADHVFFDGCKRTGMSAMEVFLISNGYQLPVAGDEIRDVGIRIAKHVEENYTREELARWVRSRMRFIPVL